MNPTVPRDGEISVYQLTQAVTPVFRQASLSSQPIRLTPSATSVLGANHMVMAKVLELGM